MVQGSEMPPLRGARVKIKPASRPRKVGSGPHRQCYPGVFTGSTAPALRAV
ncbi:MAG: hypothetical protein ACFFCS_17570 [Candidatus Hodarchaeota archaeon]